MCVCVLSFGIRQLRRFRHDKICRLSSKFYVMLFHLTRMSCDDVLLNAV